MHYQWDIDSNIVIHTKLIRSFARFSMVNNEQVQQADEKRDI